MDFFLDTACIDDINNYKDFISGVTTNPSLIAKEMKRTGRKMTDVLKEICCLVDGPVSAEVISTDLSSMLIEAKELIKISKDIVIKLPVTKDGLHACKQLSKDGIAVNMTLCFSAAQALLAAKVGAVFISPFIGRLQDHINSLCMDTKESITSAMKLIGDINEIFNNDPDSQTSILAASIRNVSHVIDAFKAGADIATVPPKIIDEMMLHPLTEQGLKIFENDFKGLVLS